MVIWTDNAISHITDFIDEARENTYLVAKEYMEKKKLCTEEEKETLLKEYDKINKTGIPFVVDNLLTNGLMRILIYAVISAFIYFLC